MTIVESHGSQDGLLTVAIERAEDGVISVGFLGGDWHTHPDILAYWLDVPEEIAVARFIELLLGDRIPIIMSGVGGQTTAPWCSDNLAATVRVYGNESLIMRYWSGIPCKFHEAQQA